MTYYLFFDQKKNCCLRFVVMGCEFSWQAIRIEAIAFSKSFHKRQY